MTFDSDEQKQFFAELLANSTFPGRMVPFAAAQMAAVEAASVAGRPAQNGHSPEDWAPRFPETAQPGGA